MFFPLAQIGPPLPESGGEYIGAVGNLISATLQTAGLYTQSGILEDFDPIFNALGYLFWIAAAIGALYSMAVYGSSKKTLMLLVGPALFFFALRTTVPARATAFQVGQRVKADSEVDQLTLLRLVANPNVYDTAPNVSFLFAEFDNLVSGTVQGIVSLLVDTAAREDLVYLARETVLGKILNSTGTDALFIKLLGMGVMGDCAEVTRLQREVSQITSEIATLGATGGTRTTVLTNRLVAITDRLTLLRAAEREITADLGDYLAALEPGGTRIERVTCNDVWKFTRLAAIQQANNVIDRNLAGDENTSGIPWDEVRDHVNDAIGGGNPTRTSEIVAAYILQNTLRRTSLETLISSTVKNNPFKAVYYNVTFGYYAWADGEGKLVSLAAFQGTVPYVQGLLLFILSATFPFFCVLLIIPARMSSMVTWMALWAWVKSWDVGFAIIHFVRDVLWQFLGVSAAPLVNQLDWNDIPSVFTVINKFDPIANMTTYYTLLSVLTFAVPFITAYFFIGAGQVAQAFRTATTEVPERYTDPTRSGKRREAAAFFEANAYRNEGVAGLKAAAETAQQGGGRTAEGLLRKDLGDNSVSRKMEAESDRARAPAHFSQDQIEMRAILAMLDGRPVTHTSPGSISGALASASLNEYNERFETRPLSEGHNTALANAFQPWSDKASNSSMTIRRIARPRENKDLDDM